MAGAISTPIAISQDTLRSLELATIQDPFAVLGPHRSGAVCIVRAFLPEASRVDAISRQDGSVLRPFQRLSDSGLFECVLAADANYMLRIYWPSGVQETEDPYAFGLLLGDLDLHLFNEGTHAHLGDVFGARLVTIDGVQGALFSVWAPNATHVGVVGDFNSWDGRRHPMRLRHQSGVWELFVPRVSKGTRYKYEIRDHRGTLLPLKSDPIALSSECPPANASVVQGTVHHEWRDENWRSQRTDQQAVNKPISIYEVHALSWKRRPDGGVMEWDELAAELVSYVSELGFTHIELLPIAEHPFGGSWGYQPLGLFAPSRRFGEPEGFARFVDRCHAANLGVILDWVPAHFPSDVHGLAHFDGTPLYEHADPREGFHHDWNTLIYNFGRNEVRGTLKSSALHWLRTFHIDGLRVDAVASMLYRDYSRPAGQWIPNVYGGRENLEAIQFLRELNTAVARSEPGVVTIAEESTAWPGVTSKVDNGGLGFSYKWNMGWMHDTLQYMSHDPVHRKYRHSEMTFGLYYAFSEKFILPLSHDEVVHGKGSLLAKMPGDRWQKFANLRAYLAFMWAHPGKKLLFMGGEIGQDTEWAHDGEIRWDLLRDESHRGLQRLVADLNHLYRRERAMHERDCQAEGFRWAVGDDAENSVFAFFRFGENCASVLSISNMTPVPRHSYRIGVPFSGPWAEILNSDSRIYGGSDMGNGGRVTAVERAAHGFPYSLELTLPPLATLYLQPET